VYEAAVSQKNFRICFPTEGSVLNIFFPGELG
jgi:hypothetical protein